MLIVCPECSHDVSDKALACPSCGFPLKEDITIKTKKKYARKRMRLPNGFGRITEIKGKKLRKPFRVMVTTGKTEDGKVIGKLLKPEAYFETYNEAYAALMEYHKDPFDLDNDMTVEELYEKWSSEYYPTVSKSYSSLCASAWNYCDSVKNIAVREIRARHIKSIMESGTRVDRKGETYKIPTNMKERVKNLFIAMLDYAIERDLVDKNYAKDVVNPKTLTKEKETSKKDHLPYSEEALNDLWENIEMFKFADFLLIQSYMGWRPGELIEMKLKDVDLENWTMTGGLKTDNGKDRVVPIHPRIKALVTKRYEESKNSNAETLFSSKGKKLNYQAVKKSLTLDTCPNSCKGHRLHDGRVTFVTRAKNIGMDEYAIKRLVGHSINDLTESVYTVRDVEWLRSQIEMLP